MKRLAQFIMILAVVFGQACEGDEGPAGPAGPQGPAGPTGPQGPAGPTTVASVFEFGIDLEQDDEGTYSFYLPFAEAEIDVQESDVILVYRFRGAYDDGNNNSVLLWSPLPQVVMLSPSQTLQYTFVHSLAELLIYIDTRMDLSALGQEAVDALTTEQGFRVVIIPGSFLEDGRTSGPPVDFKNYEQVAKFFNISEANVKKISLK